MKLQKFTSINLAFMVIGGLCSSSPLQNSNLFASDSLLHVVPQSWNTSIECEDKTLPMINSVLNYKFNLDHIEHYVLEGLSIFRTLLRDKHEFCALDLMNIATDQVPWLAIADSGLSQKISLVKQFSELKTLYNSAPILNSIYSWMRYVIQATANSTHWQTLSEDVNQVWTRLIDDNSSVRGLHEQLANVMHSQETLRLFLKLRADWSLASPSCKRPRDARINKSSNVEVPSRVNQFNDPMPGSYPMVNQKDVQIDSPGLQNNSTPTNNTIHVVIKDDESSGVGMRRVSSWSAMGAVIVVLSGVALF